MSDLEEKLNAILSDPDAMAQVMNLAQSLNLGGAPQEDRPPTAESQAHDTGQESATTEGTSPFSGLNDLLGQIDPSMIQRLLPLIGELRGGEEQDRRLQLLNALRPFLKPERQEKVERAVKAARLLHLGKKFLAAMGDSSHV